MPGPHEHTSVPLATLLERARARLPQIVALRRALHREPELGLDLPRTRAAVLEAIAGLPLDVWHSERTSGVVATLKGEYPGRTLLLRADMDALPMPEDTGLDYASRRPAAMHACGHDAHSAMLVGAAHLLVELRAHLHGTVKLAFQPGEEGYFGARIMIEEGMLSDAPRVDAAFAIHVRPVATSGVVMTRPGPILASADEFDVQLIGAGGHASMPDLALDPIPAACELVQALQTLVTRRLAATDAGVLSVTEVHAGTAHNVIPERARVAGTIRALSARARERLRSGVERVARGIAAAHGLQVEIVQHEGYPIVVNHDDFTAFTLDVARELLGDAGVAVMDAPIMGAEDFSYVLQQVPGTFVFLGVAPEGMQAPADLHSNRMCIDECAMAQGAAMHAAMALRYLVP